MSSILEETILGLLWNHNQFHSGPSCFCVYNCS